MGRKHKKQVWTAAERERIMSLPVGCKPGRKKKVAQALAGQDVLRSDALDQGIALVVYEGSPVHFMFNDAQTGCRILNFWPATGSVRVEPYSATIIQKVNSPEDALAYAVQLKEASEVKKRSVIEIMHDQLAITIDALKRIVGSDQGPAYYIAKDAIAEVEGLEE